jgi:hypothetical protein
VQERDQLSGARKLIPDEAVMRQLGQFLYADPGMPEQFDDSPRPECVLLFLSSSVRLRRLPVPPPSAQILGLGSFMTARTSVWPPAVNS